MTGKGTDRRKHEDTGRAGKMAGVDISTDAPLLDTIETIGSIIDEICELTEELGC